MLVRRVSESTKDYDTIRYTTCTNMCESGCGLKVFLKDGRIVDIWGDDEHPQNYGALCPKGTANIQHAYNPLRVKYPAIRENIDDRFRRVTWDEALDFVADRLKYIREKWGAHAVACHRTGRSSFGHKMGATRFLTMYGTPNIFGQGPLCCESPGARGHYIFGAKEFLRLMNPCQDAMNSDTIFMAGSNAAALEVITMRWFVEAKEKQGAKLIVVDPRFNATMAKADLAMRLRPTTDAYLANAIAHVLIYEIDGIDHEFISKWVHGFNRYAAEMKKYTPEKAELVTWVPAEDIRKAAEWIAYPRRTHFTGCLGTAQQYNAGNTNAAYQSLVAITGNVGVKGGGWNWLHNCRPPLNAGKDLAEFKKKIKEPIISDKIIPWGDTSSAAIIHVILTEKPYPIKGFISNGDHPGTQWPNINKVRAAMKKLYLHVHLSYHPNGTAAMSHAIFPIGSEFEREGLCHHGNNRHMQWHNWIIPRQWECRSDIDFWAGLAKRFEFAEQFYAPEGESWWAKETPLGEPVPEDPNYPGTTIYIDEKKSTDFFNQQEPFTAGCTWDVLDPERSPKGGVMWPAMTKDEAMMYSDPEATIRGAQWIMYKEGVNYPGTNKRFPTPTGKVELYSEALEQMGWYPVPIHIEPNESPAARPDLWEKYPIIMSSGRLVAHFHEMGHWWPWMVELEPHRFINIHTELAKVLNIKEGDLIVAENDRGKIVGPAWVNEMVDPGEAWFPEAFDPYQPFYPYESGNVLVDDVIKDPYYTQAQYKCNLVRIYKLGDDPEEAVRKTKEFLKKIGRDPKSYPDPKTDESVHLGTYTRFFKEGSGIYLEPQPSVEEHFKK